MSENAHDFSHRCCKHKVICITSTLSLPIIVMCLSTLRLLAMQHTHEALCICMPTHATFQHLHFQFNCKLYNVIFFSPGNIYCMSLLLKCLCRLNFSMYGMLKFNAVLCLFAPKLLENLGIHCHC